MDFPDSSGHVEAVPEDDAPGSPPARTLEWQPGEAVAALLHSPIALPVDDADRLAAALGNPAHAHLDLVHLRSPREAHQWLLTL